MKHIETIQSEQNVWIKRMKALQQRKYRQKERAFVAEGLRFVKEAMAHGMVEAVFVEEARSDLLNALGRCFAQKVFFVKEGLLESVLHTVHPQGVAAIVKQPQWDWTIVVEGKQILVVDGVQDPGNLGTMIRTALASDTDAILCLKGTVDPYNDKTLRSTMGAIFQMPIYWAEDAETLVQQLHQWGYQLMIADIRAEQYYHQMVFPKKTALVVSNEANGPQLLTHGDVMVKIPLYQEAESLNVAVATGILLYAIRTQRK